MTTELWYVAQMLEPDPRKPVQVRSYEAMGAEALEALKKVHEQNQSDMNKADAVSEREQMEQTKGGLGIPFQESTGLMLLRKGVRNLLSRLSYVRNQELPRNPSMQEWSTLVQRLQKTIGIEQHRWL